MRRFSAEDLDSGTENTQPGSSCPSTETLCSSTIVDAMSRVPRKVFFFQSDYDPKSEIWPQ